MNEYHREQLEAIKIATDYLGMLSSEELSHLRRRVAKYMGFRRHVNDFLRSHFSQICTHRCYQNRHSACCSREGITTFFADVVINVLKSSDQEIEQLLGVLNASNLGMKCVYLGQKGCIWQVKPIVCEMFLCEPARKMVFHKSPRALREWERIRRREKRYTWPTRPVLFDDLEASFIQKGYSSSLMYFHNSPGLMRVKALARKGEKR
jgi:hypothetical protein